MKAVALASALAAHALAAPVALVPRLRGAGNSTGDDAAAPSNGCFPFGGATLPKDNTPPSVPHDQWWCPPSQGYGFLGFSYPLESDDCSDPSNGFDQMNQDFARMKKDFGATIVRLYYPACTEASVFENALRAGVANDMAVIPQIWFGLDGDLSVKTKSMNALYGAMTGQYAQVAPYVFHSADFGSEPIGDGVDGGPDSFVNDLAQFRQQMKGYGVPVGISEDWDRPGTMRSDDGRSLADIGQRVKQNSDFAHAHVMPFYHGNLYENQAWNYIEPQLHFLHDVVGLPGIMITETMWAYGPTDHYPNHNDLGPDQYAAYWQKFDDECETFRDLGIGWFLHAWANEDTFSMVKDDGSYEMSGFRPRKC